MIVDQTYVFAPGDRVRALESLKSLPPSLRGMAGTIMELDTPDRCLVLVDDTDDVQIILYRWLEPEPAGEDTLG